MSSAVPTVAPEPRLHRAPQAARGTGRGLPRGLRPTLVLVLLVVTVAAAAGASVRSTAGGQAAVDEPQYLLSALSLWEDGDLDVSDELAASRERPFHQATLPVQTQVLPDGSQISPHDPLLPLLLAAPMGLGGWSAAKVTLAVLAGVLAALTTWVAVVRFAVPVPLAATVVGVAGTSAPLVVYGQQVYPELVAALAVVAAVAALTGPLDRVGSLLLAGAVTALPWLSVKYSPVAAVLAACCLVLLWRRGSRALAGAVAALLAVSGVVFLAVHQVVYGGWTAYATGDHFRSSGELGVVGFAPDYLGRSVRLVGLLVDRDFGLLAWQPAWLLAVPAVAFAVRARGPHWPVLVGPLVAGWLTATFVALTMHGFWWPGRQVVVVLPLAVLLVCIWLAALRGRARAATFAAGGVLAGVGWLAYGWLLAAGRRGDLTWVGAPDVPVGGVHELLRGMLPDYRQPDAGTWTLHLAWVVVLASLAAWAAVRTPRTAPPRPPRTEPTTEEAP